MGAALRLRQTHDRDGARLLRRRGVHAAARVRFCDRGRERDLLPLGGELGDSARRAGIEGGRRHGAATPRALLRLPGRAVRRQGGRAHRYGQLRRSAREARGCDHRARREAMKKSAAVLRATKQAIRHVRTMDVVQAYDYLAEKGKAIKVADQEDSYNTGLRQFLDEKSYKPTFEPFRLATVDRRLKPAAKK